MLGSTLSRNIVSRTILRTLTTTTTKTRQHTNLLIARPLLSQLPSNQHLINQTNNAIRALSSQKKADPEPNEDGGDKDQYGEQGSIVLTPGQKVVQGWNYFLAAGIAVLVSGCGYFIVRELMPTKMSANAVMNASFDRIKQEQSIKRRFGDDLKCYGRDSGGKREGRRNFIEHTEYVAEQPPKNDGSKRTRIRFNLEGEFGNAFVFAEVSANMKSGEFVYLLVQDKRGGETVTVVDNRSMIASKVAMGDSEGSGGLSGLLGLAK